ncbi:hypothetical protein E1295_12045 [Nonomuraea mesophila]|uniref:Uncharacterized protein n=1 Tax=Nonomuraea mesophila TaxID=2530382 RepID=A0A4R5FSF0_9ACTN|nr:hypothetical protein [Nonomuraea mesophila]TDE56135.1 hypothetical protein E1295_12045 [Nonomuraea mesophila]
MAERFDVIESGGERGRRPWIGLVVVLALVLVPAVSLLVSQEPAPAPAPGPVSPQPVPGPIRSLRTIDNPPNILHAEATKKGGDEVLDVVFPHGARAKVRYPAELGLADMGTRPFQGVWVEGSYRQFVAPYGGEMQITQGGEPIRNYAPNVTLWPRPAGSGGYGQVLMFVFGPWRLAMYDQGSGLSFEERTALAEGLRGKVTKDGYLVLSAEDAGDGVRLAEPGDTVRGQPVGPQLWFGGGAGTMVVLTPAPGCERTARVPYVIRGRGRPVDSVCRGGVQVTVTGSQRFRDQVVQGIRITHE